MDDHFNKVQVCVNNYFDNSLLNGQNLIEIVERFNEDPLPQDLLTSEFTPDELRRHGQLVGSKRLIKAMDVHSAHLPESDILYKSI